MSPQHQQRLSRIIDELQTVQSQAPTKTTYEMGRADHSISHQLLSIIRDLKALADEPDAEPEPVETINITDIDGNIREVINITEARTVGTGKAGK